MTIRALVLAGLMMACASPAWALRCDGRIVEVGDHALQVRERCGEPYWVDRYSEWLITGENGPREQRVERTVEAWYYNFGSNRLLQRLVFRDDRLTREESLGYGFTKLPSRCDVDALPRGTSNGEIIARCGEPSSQVTRYGDTVERDGLGNARVRVSRREEWVYDPGDSRDYRLLLLIDGKLSEIQRLDR